MAGGRRSRRLAGSLLSVALCLTTPVGIARAAEPPALGTTWASEVGPETAMANAFVNPHGLPTAWRFEYLTDAAYAANLAAGREAFAGASVAPVAGEAAPLSYSQVASWPLAGLAPSTTYHLRAVLESAGGATASLAPPLFFTTSTVIACEGDACQPLPSAPEDPTPGTQVPTLGNPPVRFPPKHCAKGKHRVERHSKTHCVARRRHERRRHGHRHHHRRRR